MGADRYQEMVQLRPPAFAPVPRALDASNASAPLRPHTREDGLPAPDHTAEEVQP